MQPIPGAFRPTNHLPYSTVQKSFISGNTMKLEDTTLPRCTRVFLPSERSFSLPFVLFAEPSCVGRSQQGCQIDIRSIHYTKGPRWLGGSSGRTMTIAYGPWHTQYRTPIRGSSWRIRRPDPVILEAPEESQDDGSRHCRPISTTPR